ncbi:MAG: aminotransferase class V-fold PLP-dependent enzyme [Patescibacteria group bacterium]
MSSRPDLSVVGQGRLVPTAGGRDLPYVNLDNAASTPALCGVAAKVGEFLPWYASVHRGAGFKSRLATEIYEQARRIVAEFFGYDPATNVVIFGKNTTEALNKLAHRWPWQEGDMAVTSLAEHHSNDLPWRDKATMIYIGLRPDGTIDLDHLSWAFSAYAPRIRLVALTGASNVTGCLTNLHLAASLAHRHGARIVVDAAQLAAHRPVDALPDDDPGHLDFLAVSGHKIYAPYGAGALIGPRWFFAQGAPEYAGGGTVSGVTLGRVKWAAPPERDEAGTPNVLGAVALAAALRILSDTGLDAIEARERKLLTSLVERLRCLPGLILYGPAYPDVDRVGILSFNISGLPHGLVAAILACEHAIGVRSGCFCARPYVQRLLGIGETEAIAKNERAAGPDPGHPGMVRISLGLYNSTRDIDRLVYALEKLTADPLSYRNRYEFDPSDGYWWPRGWRPRYDRCFSL